MAWPWNVGLGLFKVIENGALRYSMYDFLLVRHCNYSSILYRLQVIWRWIISWTWNRGYRSLKVIEISVIRKLDAVSYLPSIVTVSGRRLPSCQTCRPRSSWLTVSRQYDAGHPSYDDVTGRQHLIAVAEPRVWNSLSPAIRDPSLSPSIFGKLLKTYLFV